MVIPCLVNIFKASEDICLSAEGKKSFKVSRISTSEPNRDQILPISKPIAPAPITANLSGTF